MLLYFELRSYKHFTLVVRLISLASYLDNYKPYILLK